jgi:hypothetical protein
MKLTISEQETITITALSDATCASADGSVTIEANSPISLNGGTPVASPATFTGLAAGFYTATSSSACPAEVSFVINNTDSNISAILSKTYVSCAGGADGAVIITAGGGVPDYTFELVPGGIINTSGVFTGLGAGSYTVNITDANSCNFVVNFDITEPTPLVLSLASQNNIGCVGGATGSVVLTTSGGTPGYTYTIDRLSGGKSCGNDYQ